MTASTILPTSASPGFRQAGCSVLGVEVDARALPDLPLHPQSALDGYAPQFAKAADGMRSAGAFGEPEQWRFDWEQPFTRDEWLEQIPTHGYAGQLAPAELAALLAGMGAAVDAAGGSFVMRYATIVVTAAVRSTPAR